MPKFFGWIKEACYLVLVSYVADCGMRPVRPVAQRVRSRSSPIRSIRPWTLWSPDGSILASGDQSGYAVLWIPDSLPSDSTTPSKMFEQSGFNYIAALACSRDGSTLASADSLQSISLWNPYTQSSGSKTPNKVFDQPLWMAHWRPAITMALFKSGIRAARQAIQWPRTNYSTTRPTIKWTR